MARPLPSGKADMFRTALASCWVGARAEAHKDARRRAGIVREAFWIEAMPGGDVAVMYLEADDLAVACTILGTSPEPFDRWFRDAVLTVLGIGVDGRLATPELLLDFDVNRI